MEVLGARNFHRSKRLEVWGEPLHIKQSHAVLVHGVNQVHQCHFRRISHQVKHRFASKKSTNTYPVQAANEYFVFVEYFNAVRPSKLV